MDRVIAEVLKRIAERKTKMKAIPYSERGPLPSERTLIDFGQITLQGMTIALLLDLYQVKKQEPWVAWLLKGISYDVHFTFQINANMVNFIPLKMLRDWPVTFEIGSTQLVKAFYQRSIGRAEIAALPDHTLLVVSPTQRLTVEALTVMAQKHITKQVRTDEDCIWQK
ncbi:PduM family microcompartment protein [Levilactobacillus angrenensis]|uniref:PduM family microcompartment protein n=1 Tax=Levilactobacillus angrenensis TaxID=2486020 RepID=A0ABW1UB68_9LACO|nr:PduM family microcompartment protein [Levilactobacillus angrenensis]